MKDWLKMFIFVGVLPATNDDYMNYFFQRPMLLHDYLVRILIVESKFPDHCLAFVNRETGGDWMLLYHVEDAVFTQVLDNIVEDAKHREELLNRYDGAEWFAQWRL